MKISRLGEAPDYRFSLANERTFLAWIRTALGFLAAGVGLDQLAPDFAIHQLHPPSCWHCCCASFPGGLAIYGYLRWLRNEKAMRLKRSALHPQPAGYQPDPVVRRGDCDGVGAVWR